MTSANGQATVGGASTIEYTAPVAWSSDRERRGTAPGRGPRCPRHGCPVRYRSGPDRLCPDHDGSGAPAAPLSRPRMPTPGRMRIAGTNRWIDVPPPSPDRPEPASLNRVRRPRVRAATLAVVPAFPPPASVVVRAGLAAAVALAPGPDTALSPCAALAAAGLSLREIARVRHMSRKTVRKDPAVMAAWQLARSRPGPRARQAAELSAAGAGRNEIARRLHMGKHQVSRAIAAARTVTVALAVTAGPATAAGTAPAAAGPRCACGCGRAVVVAPHGHGKRYATASCKHRAWRARARARAGFRACGCGCGTVLAGRTVRAVYVNQAHRHRAYRAMARAAA